MYEIERIAVNPPRVHAPLGAYSHAMRVRSEEVIYIAGQIAVNETGEVVGAGDVAAQTRQVFENIGDILAELGASFGNVVEFTTFLVGRESLQPFIETRGEIFPTIFPDGIYPPNTLLIISGLAQEELKVEVKTVAALP